MTAELTEARIAELRILLLSRHVVASGCWVYTGARIKDNYGVVSIGGRKKLLAHRASYRVFIGLIPIGMHICHRCDNPPCINPLHLFPGTDKDNLRDAMQKGRHIGFCQKKLTTPLVEQIEKRLADGEPPLSVARSLNVHNSTIYRIRSGKMWGEKNRRLTQQYLGGANG